MYTNLFSACFISLLIKPCKKFAESTPVISIITRFGMISECIRFPQAFFFDSFNVCSLERKGMPR